ncbi:hypothetical protein [Streptomyces sp. V4I2]|uniref:hypothetical protein n=1 Tax=Streptomyces sp. V4I2 TaxID=3042280 RepID=UPI0027D8E63C|nr:hypothetical protein [Streptomyces sp. V4I2]
MTNDQTVPPPAVLAAIAGVAAIPAVGPAADTDWANTCTGPRLRRSRPGMRGPGRSVGGSVCIVMGGTVSGLGVAGRIENVSHMFLQVRTRGPVFPDRSDWRLTTW